MKPELEAFASESGGVTAAWEIGFSDRETRQEVRRCAYPQADGSFRDGTVCFTLEISKVRFRTPSGALAVGTRGQLSSPSDRFHEVAVLGIEAAGGYDLVIGEAQKRTTPQFDRHLD